MNHNTSKASILDASFILRLNFYATGESIFSVSSRLDISARIMAIKSLFNCNSMDLRYDSINSLSESNANEFVILSPPRKM